MNMAAYNVTTNSMALNGLTSYSSLLPVIGILLFTAVVFAFLLSAFSYPFFRWLHKKFEWLGKSFVLFGWGLGAYATISAVAFPFWFLSREVARGNATPLYIVGGTLGGYLVTCAVGALARIVVLRIKRNYQTALREEQRRCRRNA